MVAHGPPLAHSINILSHKGRHFSVLYTETDKLPQTIAPTRTIARR